MKTSQDGITRLIKREGEVLHAYKDSIGVWTIGVGHTKSAGTPVPKAGMTITKEESRQILARDLVKFETRVNKAFGKTVPQNVFDGAVSFDFNTGDIDTASWVPLYLKGNMKEAEVHFLYYNKPSAIIGRRKDEAKQIFHESPPAVIPVTAPETPVPSTPVPSTTDVKEVIKSTGSPEPVVKKSFFQKIIDFFKGWF